RSQNRKSWWNREYVVAARAPPVAGPVRGKYPTQPLPAGAQNSDRAACVAASEPKPATAPPAAAGNRRLSGSRTRWYVGLLLERSPRQLTKARVAQEIKSRRRRLRLRPFHCRNSRSSPGETFE